MKRIFAVAFVVVAVTALAPAQLVFSFSSNGVSSSIFQQQSLGGVVSPVNTGFSEENFAALSRNGRFITFSSPDAAGPLSPPSSDLYLHDRVTGQTRRIVDNTTAQLPPARPGGPPQIVSVLPELGAISPGGELIVYSNRGTLFENGSFVARTNDLQIVRTDGAPIPAVPTGVIEEGAGAQLDLLRAEFVGVSWSPDGNSLVTSAYITIQVPGFGPRPVPGIVRYARAAKDSFARSAALSLPRFTSTGAGIGSGIQIFPALSPTGGALAYFDVDIPDSTTFRFAATTRLIVANADGSGPVVRATFNAGFYPLGVTWSADGSQLVFSIAPQLQLGGQFRPLGDPAAAIVRATAPFGGNTTITQMPNISGGFLPFLPSVATPNPPVDLAGIRLSLTPTANGFRLGAAGLDPSANYIFESSTTLGSFINPVSFTGSQIMGGVAITKDSGSAFFRLRAP